MLWQWQVFKYVYCIFESYPIDILYVSISIHGVGSLTLTNFSVLLIVFFSQIKIYCSTKKVEMLHNVAVMAV